MPRNRSRPRGGMCRIHARSLPTGTSKSHQGRTRRTPFDSPSDPGTSPIGLSVSVPVASGPQGYLRSIGPANGYTTLVQASLIEERLHLDAGDRLLDVGSG